MRELNWRLVSAVLVTTIGPGFQHGYHTGLVNISREIFKKWIFRILSARRATPPDDKVVTIIWNSTIAMFSLGGALGGLLTKYVHDKYGCKRSLLWNNLFVMAGICFLAVSYKAASFEMFMVGRLLVGINAGLNSGICPMYLVDIAPIRIRGAIAGFYQFMITVGISLSQCSSLAFGTKDKWPFIFVVALIPTAFQILALPFIPDSPKYQLIVKDDEPETERTLQWFTQVKDVHSEMEALKQEDNILKEARLVTLKRMCTETTFKLPLIVCLVIMFGQQLCGINAMTIYFSTETFKHLGLDRQTAMYLTISLGFLNVVATLSSLYLLDVLGRRFMLLSGFMALCLVTIALTCCFIAEQNDQGPVVEYSTIVLIHGFILLYAPGIGTVPWFISAELFHYTARSLAVSLVVAGNWLANYLVGQTFKIIKESIGPYVYLIFGFLDLFFFFYTYKYLPETARKSPKEIIEMYKRR